MCQVFIVSQMSKVKDLPRLVNSAAKHLLAKDDDGFGWSALGAEGLFGERTINKEHVYRLNKNNLTVRIPFFKETYNHFGTKSELVGAGLFHGRTSTNVRNLLNTHPIVKNNWALIHNGVVDNLGPKYDMLTSNDTEHILHYMSTVGIGAVEENLSGYFAFGAIDPIGQLHVVRDDMARLHVVWNESLGCHVFGTSPELIQAISKDLKWKIGPIESVIENIHMVFDKTGNVVGEKRIDPIGYTYSQSKYLESSLHLSSADIAKATLARVDAELLESESKEYSRYATYSAEPAYRQDRDDRLFDSTNDDEVDAYLDMLMEVDETFQIYNGAGVQIDSETFHQLDTVSKLECEVYFQDGTILDAPKSWSSAGNGY